MSDAAPLPELSAYEVLAPIAQGGMANVYLAKTKEGGDGGAKPLVALKVLRPELCAGGEGTNEFVAMFLDEARIASRFAHPHIAAIHGLGHEAERYFLAMELLRGRTLLDVADAAYKKGERVPFALVAWIGARIAEALEYVHDFKDERGENAGIVHRDVTPSNIFLTADGTPKLIDFGLAKARDRIGSTAHGIVKGKLAYLAPEQVAGAPVGRGTDIFALAVSLWEVAVGERLFRADDDVETVRRVASAEVPDPRTKVEGFPDALATALLHALVKAPEKRTRSAGELARELDLASQGVTAADVAAFVASVMPEGPGQPWEQLADEGAAPASRELGDGSIVRAWDDERKKLTWMAVKVDAAEEPTTTVGDEHLETVLAQEPASSLRGAVEEAISQQLAELAPTDNAGRARLLLERAIADEALGGRARTVELASAAAKAAPSATAFALARRREAAFGKASTPAVMRWLDAEIERIADPKTRADLLGARGRALMATDDFGGARVSFERALELAPTHPASLRGLEAALRRVRGARGPLAAHLARMADAYQEEPSLAAWLLVERAAILDEELGRVQDACDSLKRALLLESGAGPVRRAAVRFAEVHRMAPWLAELLENGAAFEPSADGAAALELSAAELIEGVLGDRPRAVVVLERTRARRGVSPLLRRLVLDALLALYRAVGDEDGYLAVRRERLDVVVDATERAGELLAVATAEARAGDVERALGTLAEARRLSPSDVTVREALVRVLEQKGDTTQLIELFANDAATSLEATRRAESALRGVRLAEAAGRRERAIELARIALAADPGNREALEALDGFSEGPLGDELKARIEGRIANHRLAAEHALDSERRIAHLELVALNQEELLGDAAGARATYEAILALDGRRRFALAGVERTARKLGDTARAAAALLSEMELTTVPEERRAIGARAVQWLERSEPVKALALAQRIVEESPDWAEGRALLRRLLEACGAWDRVALEIERAAELETDDAERGGRLLERARLERDRMGAPAAALATARRAREQSPRDPRVSYLLADLHDSLSDADQFVDATLALAEGASDDLAPRLLYKAAVVAEHRGENDARALSAIDRAVDATGGPGWLLVRRRRLLARMARHGDRDAERRLLLEMSPIEWFLATGDSREVDASEVEALLASETKSAAVVRRAELFFERAGDAARQRDVLWTQATTFMSRTARLGALWEALRLSDEVTTGRRALELTLSLAPDDRAALDVATQWFAKAMHEGDDGSRGPLALALRDLAQTHDTTQRWAALLELGLVLAGARGGEREAIKELRLALRVDRESVVAGLATLWLAESLRDVAAGVEAARALAEATRDDGRAAHYLKRGADLLLQTPSTAGSRRANVETACELLERSLARDPERAPAVLALVAARHERGEPEKLEPILAAVVSRARHQDAIAAAGIALAQLLAKSPETATFAVAAARKVVAARPGDVTALRLLADLLSAQGARGEAVVVLERIAHESRDPAIRTRALSDVVALHRASGHVAEVEEALRGLLEIDPMSVTALRDLAALRRGVIGAEAEVVTLLERLAEVAPGDDERAEVLLELAERHAARGDAARAEQETVEAAALAPSVARLEKVVAISAGDAAVERRLLEALVARGEALGRPSAAAWALLGQLEVERLGDATAGVAHLKRAVALEPAMTEARLTLARGLLSAGAADEATRVALGLMFPDAAPLLSLRDPGSLLATLEAALFRLGRRDEAIVVREVRAIAGALDDAGHVELLARRRGPVMVHGEREHLFGLAVADEARDLISLLGCLAGIENRIARSDLDELDVHPKRRLASAHPLAQVNAWLARLVGIDALPLLVSERIPAVRIVLHDGDAFVAVPATLEGRSEPEQVASLARAACRVALAVPYVDELDAEEMQALVVATAVRAKATLNGAASALADEMGERLDRLLGRRQRKALAEHERRTMPSLRDGGALAQRTIAQAELRFAFLVTGDLLATLETWRASQPTYRRETEANGPRALAALLTHPVTADLVRAAMSPTTTLVRERVGTRWTGGSLAPPRR